MELVGDYLRGHTDTIILSILEYKDSYGYEINSTITQATSGEFNLTEATLYTAFKRLEKSEYIRSYWKEGLNNTKRKYYSLTPQGLDYLNLKRRNWEKAVIILNQLIGIKIR